MAVSQYDKERLTESQQAEIQKVTELAQAGSMDWSMAHSIAEGIRSQAAGGGYSGGQDGSGYISSGKSGSSGGATGTRDYTGTTYQSNDYHRDAINAAAQGDWDKVMDALNNREIVAGSQGTNYGKTSMDIYNELVAQYGGPNNEMDELHAMLEQLQEQISQPVQSYPLSWGDKAYEQLLQQAIAMNYEDWTQSDQYKALADRYGIQGKMTMQDILGQISSRTGGLASSYATTAAQQQYNEYMSQLEEVARQMFAGERSDVIENAVLAREYGEQEYARYLDQLNMQSDRNSAALGIINQMMGYQADKENTQYNRDQNAKAEAQDRINAYLAAYGTLDGLDPNTISASGYTDQDLDVLAQIYLNQNGTQTSTGSGSGSGSGGGNGGGGNGGTGYEALFTAALNSQNPESFIAQNYQNYGFSKSTGLVNDYKEWLERADKGVNFDSVWRQARRMYDDENRNVAEIVSYLMGKAVDGSISVFGQEYILDQLNIR